MQINCNCCKDCEKRQIGCHSNCEDYLLFREKKDKYNKQSNQYKKELKIKSWWLYQNK